MDDKKLFGAALIAFAFYSLSRPKVVYVPVNRPQGNLNTNYIDWVKYVQSVLASAAGLYTTISDLWKEGGPFYKTPVPEWQADSPFWKDVNANVAGLGKLTDTRTIRPRGRVDQYWGEKKNIKPQAWGVASYDSKYFIEPSDAIRHFNLHSIEFGNWVNQEDRFGFMYATLVTLRDIGNVTGITQDKLGMSKTLALAFGARGTGGGAAAFYIPPPYFLINLTKTQGRGTFIHEYGHAVDYYLGAPTTPRSTRKRPKFDGLRKDSAQYLFEKVFEIILWNENGSPSTYQDWLSNATEYYNRRTEIWARICERYFHWQFQERGIYNTWGVSSPGRDWPALNLVKKAAPYISKIFKKLNTAQGPSRIGAIYPDPPLVFECNDGTFSTSQTPRACVKHGGLKDGVPVQLTAGSNLISITDIPVGDIQIDTKLFQGRESAFSERSVSNIIADVQAGTFIWENLDPVTIWRSREGRLYILAGFSRLEAFRRLSKAGMKARGKGFDRIPAKVMKDVPIEVAKTVALESNTLSTKETDQERAAYYRTLRQDGADEKKLLEAIKKNEGRNWTNVYAYTFLNPSGRPWATMRQFGQSEDTSATLAKSLVKWIGSARRQFPALTNAHENELFVWLFEQNGYGTGRGQVKSEREFLDRVAEFVAKNTFFGAFDQNKPLNIQNLLTRSPVEMQYDQRISEATRDAQEAEKILKQTIRDLTGKGAKKSEIQRITAPLEARVRNTRIHLQTLLQQRDQVIQYSKNEPALFGIRRLIHH